MLRDTSTNNTHPDKQTPMKIKVTKSATSQRTLARCWLRVLFYFFIGFLCLGAGLWRDKDTDWVIFCGGQDLGSSTDR
jgi:hypothetical protein